MSSYPYHYRLTIYKPRSVDATETAILVGNGTVHSDNFKVITKQGVSGWQPYLMPPKGRKGRIDLLSRKTDVGKLTFQILDKRTADTSNLSRWLSGFLGAGGSTIPGKVQFGGCKVLVEESTDDGATWATFFTGRIQGASLDTLITYGIEVVGLAGDLLNARAFRGRPHSGITYAAESCLMPLGISQAFGGIAAIPSYAGTVNPATNYPGAKAVYLSAAAKQDSYNIVTQAFVEATGAGGSTFSASGTMYRIDPEKTRLRVRLTTGGNTYEYKLIGVQTSGWHSTVAGNRIGFYQLVIAAQDATAPLYGAIPADASAVTDISIRLTTAATNKARPLLLTDVHPVQLLADLLDGKFGALDSTGAILRTYPRDASSFATLIADATFPSVRFRLTEPVKLFDWIADNLLKPYGLALYENGAGNLVVVDVRPPTSLAGLTTLTDADLTVDDPAWSWDRAQSFGVVEVTTYVDTTVPPQDLTAVPGPWPAIDASLTSEGSAVTTYELGTLLDGDFNERDYKLNATGMRATYGETVQARERAAWVAAWANTLALNIAKPFAAGPITVTVTCRRTSNVTGLTQGGLCVLDSDRLPDPTTNLRGGALIGRILEKSEQGATIELRCLILGPAVTAGVPTVGALGAGTTAQHEITVPVTLNANSDPVVVHVAITATSVGSLPADTSALWTYAYRATATGTITLKNLPSGVRVWVRARSEPNPKKGDTTAASAWVQSTGTDYQDTTAVAAPSSLTTSAVTSKSARLSWANGSVVDYGLRIYLASGASSGAASAASVSKVIDLPPGTTFYDLFGLDAAGPWYKPEVCFFDALGAESPHLQLAGVTFEATGTAAIAPTPVAISVYDSRSLVTATASPERAGVPLSMGVPLIITPGGVGYGVVIERALDSGGSPGTYAELASIPAIDLKDQGFLVADTTARGTSVYWYRAKHTQAGFDDSDYCTAISGTAQVLPLGWDSSTTIYPVNRQQPMTDGKYAVQATGESGVTIDPAVVRSDGVASRSLVSGVQVFTATHGQALSFSPVFQSVPSVSIRGGILYEPRSKWGSVGDGSETGAVDATKPQYEDAAALNLTAGGCTVRARLRQKATTVTARTNDFTGGNSLTSVAATTAVVVANAPSNNDQYVVSLQTYIELFSRFGGLVEGTLVVSIQSDASGAYVTLDTITHVFASPNTAGDNDTQQWSRTVSVSGLSSSEHIRLKVESFTVTGVAKSSAFEVNGYDGTVGSPTHGVAYDTSTDNYASKTPDSGDTVTVVVTGIQ